MEIQHDLFEHTDTSVSTQTHTDITPFTETVTTTRYTPQVDISGDMLLEEYVCSESKRIWNKSKKHHDRSIAQIAKFIWFDNHASMKLRDFKSQHAHRFLDYLSERGASESTQNRYAATISKVFSYAVKTNIIDTPVVVTFHDETGKGRPRAFTEREQELLLDYFLSKDQQWMHDMVYLSLKTGMRRGEVISVMRGEAPITPDEKWITLPAPITKTRRERSIPIGQPQTAAAAKRLAAMNLDEFNDKTFYRWWSKARNFIAPGDKHFTFHVCRHTCLTKLSDKGTNSFTIATLAGHRSLSTSQKYIHTRDEALQDLAALT